MKNDLIITGWGWMEYAVAAAVALKALGGNAEVRGISKKHLPYWDISWGQPNRRGGSREAKGEGSGCRSI